MEAATQSEVDSPIDQSAVDLLEPIIARIIRHVQGKRIVPAVTYRMQFRDEWTFDDATAVVPYLHELGVSHIYASPYMRARAGSPHGYDVCDPNQLSPALGGEEAFRRFTAALADHGMGHIVDVVPNHMAAATENPWWRDVLENGPSSPYSGYFDIDWHPVKDELENKVLLPQLGSQYGDALESGQLKITHQDGRFEFQYFQHTLPLGPKTTIPILTHRVEELQARTRCRELRRVSKHRHGAAAFAGTKRQHAESDGRAAARKGSDQAPTSRPRGPRAEGRRVRRRERANLQRS